MADEGLVFRFVFQDDSPGAAASGSPSSSPPPTAAPPEAAPGAAMRARPQPPDASPPQPRRPPPDTSPARPSTSSTSPGQPATDQGAATVPQPDDRPRRRRPRPADDQAGDQTGNRDNPRGEAGAVGQAGPRERRPRAAQPANAESRESGEAAKLLNDLVHHLQQIPGIGRAIGSMFHVTQPLVEAVKRIRAIREDQAKRQAAAGQQPQQTRAPRPPQTAAATTPAESPAARSTSQPAESKAIDTADAETDRQPAARRPDDSAVPVKPFTEAPAPRKPPAEAAPIGAGRPVEKPNPDLQFPVRPFRSDAVEDRKPRPPQPPVEEAPEPREAPAPGGFKIAGDPDQQAAMQKLIAALGPLPEGNKEVREALRPLTGLGYTLAELVSAVRSMRHADEEKAPGVEGARPASGGAGQPPEPPDNATAAAGHGSRAARQPRAPQPPPVPATQPAPRQPPPNPPPQPAPRQPQPADAGAPPPPSPGGATQAAGGLTTAGAFMLGPEAGIAAIAVVAVVGAATRAFSGLINAVRSTDRLFTDLSHRLAAYSPKLAEAEARASISQLLGDIRQARELGPDLAEYTKQRARLDRSLQKIETNIEKIALGSFLNPLLEAFNDGTESMSDGWDWLKDFATEFFSSWDVNKANIDAGLKALKREMERQRKEKEELQAADIMGIFFGDHPGRLEIGGVDFGNIDRPIAPAPIKPGPGSPPGMGIGF